MSRPTYKSLSRGNVQFNVSPEWYASIVAVSTSFFSSRCKQIFNFVILQVSRNSCNQLVRVKNSVVPTRIHYIANKFGTPNQIMRDIIPRTPSTTIAEQSVPMTLDLDFYFSTVQATTGRKLADDNNRSADLQVIPVRLLVFNL